MRYSTKRASCFCKQPVLRRGRWRSFGQRQSRGPCPTGWAGAFLNRSGGWWLWESGTQAKTECLSLMGDSREPLMFAFRMIGICHPQFSRFYERHYVAAYGIGRGVEPQSICYLFTGAGS